MLRIAVRGDVEPLKKKQVLQKDDIEIVSLGEENVTAGSND